VITPKPSVVSLNASHAFAQHLLLMVPFTEGSGQPGIIRGADGVAAGAPTTTTWTGTPATWSSNSGGTCMHVAAGTANPLRIGDVGSGAWLPTGDCTVAFVYGASTSVGSACSNSYADSWFKSAITGTGTFAASFLCASGGVLQWAYGHSTGGGNCASGGTATHHLDPPDTWVLTAGAAGMAIYRNGVAFGSLAGAATRTSDATELLIMNMSVLQDVNFFQVSAMQWDAATAAAWAADPYAHLVSASAPSAFSLLGVG
jgi:hypothetical protein